MKIGEAYVDIELKLDAYRAQLDKARLETGKATKTMGQKFEALAPTFRKVGMGMTIAGGAITAMFGLAVKSSIDFNKEMANIATLIPGSTKRINEFKSAIRTMAVDVGKDTGDLAQGAYQVISAFGDTADTVDILGIAAKAATAGVATTTDSINLLSAVTKGYGDTSREAVQKASDLAFQTVTLGQTTFPELATSIGRVIPLTAELGVSQEELFAVMATGTGVTGKAAEVSTQLRGIMQSLMSPTADMTKLFEDMGYKSGKAMLAEEGLAGALEIIKNTADASNIPLQKFISSIEGQTLALALTGTQADTYIEKLAAMRDSVGLTDVAFKEQTEGINKAGFAFQQAKQQIAVLGQEIGDKLLPMVVPLIERVREVVKAISIWAQEHPALTEMLVKFGAILGAVMLVGGPLLMMAPTIASIVGAMGGLIAFLPTVGTAFVAVSKVIGLAMLTPPVGIIVAIITAIGLLYLAWTKNWGGIQEKTRAVVNFITGYFVKFVNFISENVLNPIIEGFETWANAIVGSVGWLLEKIIGLFGKLPNFILKTFGTSKDEVKAFAEEIRDKFKVELGRIPKIAEDAFKWQEPVIEKTKEMGEETSELGKEMVKLGEVTEPVLNKAKEGMEGFGGATKRTAKELATLKERMDKLRAGAESMGLEQEKMQNLIAQTAMTATEKVEDLRKQLGLTKESIADVFASAEARTAAAEAGTEAGEAFAYGESPGGFIPTIKEAIEKHLAPIYRLQEEKILEDWNAFLSKISGFTFKTYEKLHSYLKELRLKDRATLAGMFQDWQDNAEKINNVWRSFTSSVKGSIEAAFTTFIQGTSTVEQAWNKLVDVIKSKFLAAMAQAILAQLNFTELLESVDWAADSFEGLADKIGNFMENVRGLWEEASGALVEGWEKAGAEVDKYKVKIDESSDSVRQLTENVKETIGVTESLSSAVSGVAGAMLTGTGGHLGWAGLEPVPGWGPEWSQFASLQAGGLITKAGIAKVEKGETYYPPGKSPVTRNYSFNFTFMPGTKISDLEKGELRSWIEGQVRPILIEFDERRVA